MNNIMVLDVTLRDGGCVIDFNFGRAYMNKILFALEKTKVDIIEVGYIDSLKGSAFDRTQFIDEKAIYHNFLTKKKPNYLYVAMIDHGKFDPHKLETKNDLSIDGIRYCFHKKDFKNIISNCKEIINKGYKLFLQPMITISYSDQEFLELINIINTELSNAFGLYIVDSFGEMRFNNLEHLFNLADTNLCNNICLGFHSHNNLQLSYSNVISLLNIKTSRTTIIDSSIMGMGKGAGNLNTELLLEHLNMFYSKQYDISSLLEIIDEVIKPLHAEHYWGYSIEYFLSSKYHCTPSYASFFYNKHMLNIRMVGTLLSLISEEKRQSFDKLYAEGLYESFLADRCFDDNSLINYLESVITGKEALIIAPGKSIIKNKETIEKYLKKDNIVSFSLNFSDEFSTDFVIITRSGLNISQNKISRFLVSSRIKNEYSNIVNFFNHNKWSLLSDGILYDSSSIVCINILKRLNVKKIYLAGFDGFSHINSDNYYCDDLRNSLSIEQARLRNNFYYNFFKKLKRELDIEFVTKTIYED